MTTVYIHNNQWTGQSGEPHCLAVDTVADGKPLTMAILMGAAKSEYSSNYYFNNGERFQSLAKYYPNLLKD